MLHREQGAGRVPLFCAFLLRAGTFRIRAESQARAERVQRYLISPRGAASVARAFPVRFQKYQRKCWHLMQIDGDHENEWMLLIFIGSTDFSCMKIVNGETSYQF
jgi:hypothetical protein